MAGISAKAVGSLANNYKFNSSSELNNDLDISLYETPLRGYDMQIGRFGAIDIMAEEYHSFSGYAFVGNNPVVFSDPSGAKKMFVALHDPSNDPAPGNGDISANPQRYNAWGGGSGFFSDDHNWMYGGGGSNSGGGLSYTGLAAISVFNSIKSAYNKADANGDWSYTAGGAIDITPQMVKDYLASQNPKWLNIEVTESSGYSKEGAGFHFSAEINTNSFASFNGGQIAKDNDVEIGFFTLGQAGKFFGSSGQGDDEGLVYKTNVLNGALSTSWGAKENIMDFAVKLDPTIENLKYFKGVKIVTKGLVGLQVVTSGYQVAKAWSNSDGDWKTNDGNKWGVTGKAGLDITMAAIGAFGGPVGWVVSGAYFVGDMAGLWGDWGEAPKH